MGQGALGFWQVVVGGLVSATSGGFSSLSWVGCHLRAVFVTSLGSGSFKSLGRMQPGPVPALGSPL